MISLDPAPVPPPSLAPSLALVKFLRFLRLSFSDTPTTNKADNRQTDSHLQCSVNWLVPDEIRQVVCWCFCTIAQKVKQLSEFNNHYGGLT